VVDDEDMMDIDDTADGMMHPIAPSHPLDVLHLEVIDHFSRLLVELVDRIGGSEVPRTANGSGVMKSRYAPSWAKKVLKEWTVMESLEYLGTKKQLRATRRQPKLEVFLLTPHNGERGWRRGQDWSKRDWEIAEEALEEIGRVFDDRPIEESVGILRGYAENTFLCEMRPTGI